MLSTEDTIQYNIFLYHNSWINTKKCQSIKPEIYEMYKKKKTLALSAGLLWNYILQDQLICNAISLPQEGNITSVSQGRNSTQRRGEANVRKGLG